MGDAQTASLGQMLRQGLHGNTLKLVMARICLIVRIAAGHRGKRLLRLLKPLSDQNAFEIPSGFFDLRLVITLGFRLQILYRASSRSLAQTRDRRSCQWNSRHNYLISNSACKPPADLMACRIATTS